MATSKVTAIINELLASNSLSPLCNVEICDEYIKDSGCQIICDELSSINSIETINFRGNDIERIGAEAIIKLLRCNDNIKTVKLEWNLLGLNGALSVLCEGLKLSSVRHLDLRNNKIDGNDGKILAQMLVGNKSMNHLDLRWNNLGLIGGEYLLQSLQSDNDNFALCECLLSGNQIPVQILRSIDAELDKNKKQKMKINEEETVSNADSNMQSDDDENSQNMELMQQEMNELFGQNERMKLKISELECELFDLSEAKSAADIKQSEDEKAKNELIASYKAEREEMAQKIKELEMARSELIQSRHSDKMEFDQIKCSIQNTADIESNELRKLKDAEIETLRKNVNALHIELNEVKSTNNTLRSEILQNEINCERKCIEFETNLRSECNENLSNKMCDLEQNIRSIKKSRDELAAQMKAEKQKYVGVIEQIENEKAQYQKWLNDEQKNKTMLETEIRSKSMQMQKYSNVITQKNQQIESLKIGLNETQKSIKRLENEHQISMKRVLSQHNRQTLMLEKSLRESEQRLTISEHRKKNIELQMIKIDEEERRKICAVNEAIKCLKNSFGDSLQFGLRKMREAVEQKESENENEKKVVVDETIIEIMDDDDEQIDFMRDHNTFNQRKKKKKKKNKCTK